MHKILKCGALALFILFSWQLHAVTITGIITDTNGKPIENAIISVKGNAQQAKSDKDGKYRLDDILQGHIHLHVYSIDHVHGDKEFDDVGDALTANFTLKPSSIENIVVTANAIESSVLESVTPVSVLAGDELRKRQSPTIGDTLSKTPGIHSTYFGSVAANPVVRGNDGPRVKITQNGLDVSDASRVGADHNIGAEAANASQIEVLRGPATLQYGSGAIGGMVNIVDNRIPSTLTDGVSGAAELRHDTASDEKFAGANISASTDKLAFYLDAMSRETSDVEIPGFAEREPDEGEEPGILESSSIDTENLTAGISYIGDQGFIGFSVQQLDNFYGVPGHGHGHEEEGHDDEHTENEEGHDEDSHEEEGLDEESVFLDVDNRRYQLAGELLTPFKGINNIKLNAGYTDYEHVELEGEEIGTRFANETSEIRITTEHDSISGWHGVFGIHAVNSKFEAVGEEAFTPSNNTDTLALFIVEEKKFDDLTVQLGGRLERNKLSADTFFAPLHSEEEHEEDEHGEEHGEEEEHHEDELSEVAFPDMDYTSLSLSGGVNWAYSDEYSIALNYSRSERAPSQQELFSAGVHLATSTFDLGAFFTTNDEGEIELSGSEINEEVANNLDITWRKYSGDWGFTVSAFYNSIDDYLYQLDSGFEFEDSHDEGHDEDEGHNEEEGMHDDDDEGMHDDEDEHGHEDEEGFPILNFRQEDATLYGFEAEMHYQVNDIWFVQAYADYIRAKVDNGDLPRIPPLRIGGELSFEYEGWQGDFGVVWYDDQTKVANFESPTDGYTLFEAGVNYTWYTQNVDWIFFARGKNLSDEEARVHTSFLVNDAPLPGRSFTLGVRAKF
ncbi:TonB-dependent receptor [Agaribacter flavus]|uniref:TonB-dependent receptor n=1 Tax=Agaribacter flavus TaxID=1902781 RepID=A0ABV7FM41_9ALTE